MGYCGICTFIISTLPNSFSCERRYGNMFEFELPKGSSKRGNCLGTINCAKIAFAVLRPERESNPRIKVLQTPAFPLRHQAMVRTDEKFSIFPALGLRHAG